jgi:hypothetical protein
MLSMERYRIHAEAAVYYLTYSVVEWLPVFVSGTTCKIVTDSLTFCHHEKHLRITLLSSCRRTCISSSLIAI